MKNTKRAERRANTRRKQIERWNKVSWIRNSKLTEDERDRFFGMMKKHHFGCGCGCCKPWKHGFEYKYSFAERRKLIKDEE